MRKIYFAAMSGVFIASTIIVIEKSCFHTCRFIACLIFFILFSIGLFKPNFIFRFSHWYIDRNLEDCSDFYIFFFNCIIAFALFLTSILQLELLG